MTTERPSYTAEGVAAWRAAGAMENDPAIRNPDNLAVIFLRPVLKIVARFGPVRRVVLKSFNKKVPGGYYFHIARTKSIDAVLQDSIKDGITQLVILGAGYDSRPYRFEEHLKSVRVFEVDRAGTQERKKARLQKHFGSLPSHVTFVAVDFNRQQLGERLLSSGYDPKAKTLFIWEGVCMYLTPEAVDKTLEFIAKQSGAGSSVVFDYLYRSVIDGNCPYFGAKLEYDFVAKRGEPYIFGIEEGKTGEFLVARGFRVKTLQTPRDLEHAYLIRSDGTLHGKIKGYSEIVHATVDGRAQG